MVHAWLLIILAIGSYKQRLYLDLTLVIRYSFQELRITLTPSDSSKILVALKRRQFPVSLCFAMTINKSQGQLLSHVGLFLLKPVFIHGHFYVAVSRVTSRKVLKILICDKDGQICDSIENVVYKGVFQKSINCFSLIKRSLLLFFIELFYYFILSSFLFKRPICFFHVC